jgi:Family of unknown function (DUF6188)
MSTVGFLSGLTVHQVRHGYDLRLIASDAKWLDRNDVEVIVEAPCLVTDPDGREHRVERDDLGTIPALLALQSRVITNASAEDGTLRAAFDDGSTLAVRPHDEYEAWHIEGPGDSGVVCMPGGELAVWDE